MTTTAWPDYCKKETLAKRLNLAVGAIDQLVQRGILPEPMRIGDALLWRWEDVDNRLKQPHTAEPETVDPYLSGVSRVETAAPRQRSTKPRATVLLPDPASRN